MIEKLILYYLTNALSVPVYMERPRDCPESYVLIERTGGYTEEHIRHATFAIQSYAPSLYIAADLCEHVIEAMEDCVTVPEITSVVLNSHYNYTNTETKDYRYQAVFELTHY